ncbi:sensor domain-containing diguanylate cyclase [Hydrogenophaga crocea]|uniref:Diguanylate cyclase n=1 Tax=Hydrogenophaga crocea TaxID=2716225 RepID=A0A6G8IHT0_9BURK|nr:7TM diverse intracellular signaling domain-containing protein [Hydrogenophaga crocea]QIM52752.1 diguanylate cyclase [Hydrogenophaga crocea]
MPSSPTVWQRLGAALGLCLALIAPPTSTALAAIAAPSAGEPSRPIVLDDRHGTVDLAGRSEQLLDPNGSLGIEEIEAHRHTGVWTLRAAGDRTRLANDAALWIRFEVMQRSTDAAWELELARSGTDFIELYHRDAQGRWRVQRAGDRLPVRDWAHPDRYPVFGLDARPGEAVRYWVRIEHARVPFSGELRLHDHNTLREMRIHQQFGLGVYFGMALLLTLVALVHVAVYRDMAFALYAVYTTLLGLGMAASLGVGGQFLWPGQARWNQVAEFVLLPLMGVAGLLFVRQVAQPRRLGRLLDRLCLGLALLWLATVAWDLIAPSRLSLQAVTALGTAAMATIAAMLWRAWRSGDGWLRWFVLGMLPVLIAGALPVMRNFNLISSGFLSQYGMVIAATLEAPVLVYALLQRSRMQHESQMRARALERTEPLTGLMVRSHMMLCLHDSLVRAQRYHHSSALLLVRLDNHAELLERHGRETADRALVITASLLRSQARDVDTAARVDDQDFALLMEGPVKDTQAAGVATSLVAAGLRSPDRLPPGTTLRLRVVVALLPDARGEHGQDAEAHLRWMHEGLRLLGQDPRKAILRLNF